MAAQVIAFAPAAVALAGAVVGLVADGARKPKIAVAAVAAALAMACVLAVVASIAGERRMVAGVLAVGGGFSGLGALVFALAALSIVAGVGSPDLERRGANAVLVGVAAVGAAIAVGALDVVLLLLALETVALAGYGLVSSARTRRSDEAAMKYFVLGSVASGLFVYGIAIVVGMLGTSALGIAGPLATASRFPVMMLVAMSMIAGALCVKSGAFPFHTWVPDAYQASTPDVASFLSSVPKVAALFAILVVFRQTLFTPSGFPEVVAVFAAVAVASIVFGNLAALRQTSYTRLLGYSAVAQTGYALVGLATRSTTSVTFAFVVFVSSYAFAVLGAFALAAAVRKARRSWDGEIAGLAGLGARRPALAAGAAVCLFSLTGIPLTAGFWGKFFLFVAAVSDNMTWLAVVGVLGSVVSFGYYGRVLRAMYFEAEPESDDAEQTAAGPGGAAAVVVGICALVLLAVGVYPLFGGFGMLVRLFSFP